MVGLLAIGGLTACGDKVTVPPTQTQAQDNTVKQVTVSPAQANLNVGDKVTLAASVNAGAGVTNRTVTWSSSNATIASVDANGVVTANAAGNATIIAKSAADPTVQGAAAITVAGSNGANAPIVTVSSINQTNFAGQSVPANLAAAAGQLDVVLNVEPNGSTLKSITSTLKCGTETMTRTQTLSTADLAPAAEASTAPVTFSFNTAEFNSTTGVPTLHNGACTISASAITTAGTQSAVNTTSLTLANPDAVVLRTTAVKSAVDAAGLPWKGGDVTVAAIPVLYSGRTPATVSITLPGATTPTQTLTAATSGPTSATWAGAASSGARTTQLTLNGPNDANGLPTAIHPTVFIVDSNGNDLALVQSNPLTESDVRVDNQSPTVPASAQIPTRQQGWVNASYTFTGVGANSAPNQSYVSGGDLGVSRGTVSGNTGVNGQTTFTYYVMPASGYANVGLTNGTQVGSANCPTTGWTQVATGADLAETANNQAYVVRIVESDKLGNVRCTDVGTGIGTAGFAVQTFGVDKTAPTSKLLSSSDQAGAADANQQVNGAVPSFIVSLLDNASGFSATPLSTQLTRLAIDPATGSASTTGSAFGCPIGFNANTGACGTAATAATLAADNGSGVDGYYTFTGTALDLARNAAAPLTRSVVIDHVAPTVGGVQVPATITGGTTANFATSATDNLDLVSSNYSLQYGNNVTGSPAANFIIRNPGPALGTAFDNVLTTASSFSVGANNFIRNLQTTAANGMPQANQATGGPATITVRAYDAAGNAGTSGAVAINAANVPGSTGTAANSTIFANAQANGQTFTGTGFTVTNAGNVSNCPATGACTPANSSTVTLSATAQGTEAANAQFTNPFTQVQFYYLDPATNEWTFIGTAVAPTVTDNNTQTVRTFTWTLATPFDPPAALGAGNLNVIAVGVNANGDALTTPVNTGIVLTNP